MISVFFSIVGGVHYYIWMRIVRDAHLSAPWHQIATGAIILLGIALPLTFFFSGSLRFEISRIVTFAPYTWMGIMMLLFFAIVSVDMVKVGMFVYKKLVATSNDGSDPARRAAMGKIIAGATTTAVMGLSGISLVKAARKPVVKKISITLPKLPASFEGLKIVQISDLHVGITVGGRWLQSQVERINNLNPDIVAITGDLTDGLPAKLKKQIAPLRNLKPRLGSFFVTGNHEYYSDADGWIKEVKNLGITVLQNQSVPVRNGDDLIYIAGVNDYKAAVMLPSHAHSVADALAHTAQDKVRILLAHQPLSVHDADKHNVDLVLSGHTHGGQIFPFSLLVGLQQPYNKGLYKHSDTTQIYVNQGTFLWGPPMRLGTECEITQLTLRA